jgi:cardiolipin synthase
MPIRIPGATPPPVSPTIPSGPAAVGSSPLTGPAPGARDEFVPGTPAAPPARSGDPAAWPVIDRALRSGAQAIEALTDATLAAATPDEKAAMVRILHRTAAQPQSGGGQGSSDPRLEAGNAIARIFASTRDPIEIDRIYYQQDGATLFDGMSALDARNLRGQLALAKGSAVPGDWDGYFRHLDGVTGSTPSGPSGVEFLVDGTEVLDRTAKDIDAAKSSINISVFQWQPDEVGWKLAKKLAEKAQAGVAVRVLLDEAGTQSGPVEGEAKKLVGFMREHGIEVIVNPASLLKDHLDHRKVMVIDGNVGYAGGMNIGADYQVNWHDQQSRITGPAVSSLQDAFLTRWQQEGGRVPDRAPFYPTLAPVPDGVAARVIAHQGGGGDGFIKAAYLRAIATAEKSIRIANPYFTDDDVTKALCDAAKRGVKVQIVLPRENDMAIVQRASRAAYPALLEAGAEIYEYPDRMAHEKVAVIDGKWATFGSSNLDARSLRYNDELNVVVGDPGVAASIEKKLFEVDVAKSTRIESYSPSLRELLDDKLDNLL